MKRLAVLTAEENRDWEDYFCWYLNNGWPETEADENSWKDLQAKHDGLKHYDGCKRGWPA